MGIINLQDTFAKGLLIEFQKYGGNTFANTLRSKDDLVSYHEILNDVFELLTGNKNQLINNYVFELLTKNKNQLSNEEKGQKLFEHYSVMIGNLFPFKKDIKKA